MRTIQRAARAASLLAPLCLTACAADPDTRPRIRFSPVLPATSLVFWYVESDAQGHYGYACADGAIDSPLPDGGGLFPSLESLKAAVADADLLHPVVLNGFRGDLPKGWKVRPLTRAELAALEPALRRQD